MLKNLFNIFHSNNYTHHFIHIPKNGGISIRNALKKNKSIVLGNPLHSRYKDVVSDNFSLKYFCVIRNPWSRTVSRYLYAKQNSLIWPDNDPRKKYILKASFKDFVKDRKIFEIPDHPGKPWLGPMNSWFNQLEWITDTEKAVKCDCLRFEALGTDFDNYFNNYIDLPHANETKDKTDYRTMYDDESKEILASFFKEDIDFFGFDFESSATKNISVL